MKKFFALQHRNDISTEAFLNMRYDGTDCALMCTAAERDVSKVTITVIKTSVLHMQVSFKQKHLLYIFFQNSGGCAHGDFKKAFLQR